MTEDVCDGSKEYPTYVDADGVEWDSFEDYQIAKYIAAQKRRHIFDDAVLP